MNEIKNYDKAVEIIKTAILESQYTQHRGDRYMENKFEKSGRRLDTAQRA